MVALKTATPKFSKVNFFADCNYQPHPAQSKVHASTAPRRVLAAGARFGKTVCAAMEGVAAAMAPAERSVGWVVAPTYDLADRVYREIELIAARHLRHRIASLKEHERKLVLRNLSGGLSEIRAKSADNPVSLLGEGLDWLIVDEAARLKPSIWEGHLSQRLIDKRGWALLISTPRGKGWFYEVWRRGQGSDPDFASWNHPSWANPLLDAEAIERERARLPERVFRQEYGGEFLEGSGAVFRNVRECATGTFLPAQSDSERHFGGLDLARVEDFTVLALMNKRRQVVWVDRYHRIDWDLQVQRIVATSERYNRPPILVDSTGAGEPIYERLRASGLRVEAYPFSAKSKNDLVNNLALMLERKEVILPTPDRWPEGIDELESFEYSVTESGSVRTSAPSGQHDDCVIALALAAWLARDVGPNLTVVRAGRYTW